MVKFLILLLFIVVPSHGADLQESFEKHEVSCLNGDCPFYVGRMVYMGLGRSFCAATLVGPRHILTNAHCVEMFFGKGKLNCTGKAYFKFGNQVAGCKEVTAYEFTGIDVDGKGEDRPDLPDVALVEMDRSIDGPFADLKRSSFKDQQNLYYWKSHVSFEQNKTVLRKVHCRTKKASMIANFYSKRPLTISFAECPFEEGDSGSPMFNEKGEMVAVLSGGIPEEVLKIIERVPMLHFENRGHLDVLGDYYWPNEYSDVEFQPVGIATALTCTSESIIGGKRNCKPKARDEYLQGLLEKELKAHKLSYTKEQLDFANFDHNIHLWDLDYFKREFKHQTKDSRSKVRKFTDTFFRTSFEVEAH